MEKFTAEKYDYYIQRIVGHWSKKTRPSVVVTVERSGRPWPHIFEIKIEGALAPVVYKIAKNHSTISQEGARLFCEWTSSAAHLKEKASAVQAYADRIDTWYELDQERRRGEEKVEDVKSGAGAVFGEAPAQVQVTPTETDAGRRYYVVAPLGESEEGASKHWSLEGAFDQMHVTMHYLRQGV